MLTVKKSEFKPENYSKLTLIKNQKNGIDVYNCLGTCARCEGKGRITFSTRDHSICYICEGTGKVAAKLEVVPDELLEARKAKALAKLQAEWDARKQAHIQAGYKPIDFKVAKWFDWSNSDMPWKYYLVIKQSEKAVLISFLAELENVDYQQWFPKSAIIK